MAEQEFCQGCERADKCQDVYRRLGQASGPSVVFKVVIAFLVPMVVFIAALAVFEGILARAINTKALQTPLSFLLALLVTSALVLIIKTVSGHRKEQN